MADPLTDSSMISIISLVISFLSGVTTSILAYLKQKDTSELKEVRRDLETSKVDVGRAKVEAVEAKQVMEESKKERAAITARLDDCEKRHDDCEQQHMDCVKKTTDLAVAAAHLTSKVTMLEQQMQLRIRPA